MMLHVSSAVRDGNAELDIVLFTGSPNSYFGTCHLLAFKIFDASNGLQTFATDKTMHLVLIAVPDAAIPNWLMPQAKSTHSLRDSCSAGAEA
jgi:hypothetical protein